MASQLTFQFVPKLPALPAKANPKIQFCCCACPHTCDAEAAALSRECDFCSLSSLQSWTDEEILLGKSGYTQLWRLF